MARNDLLYEMGVRLKPSKSPSFTVKFPVSETGNDSADIDVCKKKKIFNDYFLTNGVHITDNGKTTRKFEKKVWALVDIEKEGVTQSELYESKKRRCAERLAIQKLRARVKTTLDKCKMKMYISFSPCFTCCKEIIKLKNDFNMEVKIFFSAFYKIRQYSCIEHICDHPLPITSEHDQSVNGLKDLVNNVSHVSPFSEEDWRYIAQRFEVDFDKVPMKYTRLKEDEAMRRDFVIIMKEATVSEGRNETTESVPEDISQKVNFCKHKDAERLAQMGVTVSQPTFKMEEVTGLDDTSDVHIKR